MNGLEAKVLNIYKNFIQDQQFIKTIVSAHLKLDYYWVIPFSRDIIASKSTMWYKTMVLKNT